jgi:uncharacterized membrane protein
MNQKEEIVFFGALGIFAIAAVIILIVAGIAWLVWYLITKPIDILKEKLAKGELTKEQYYDLKKRFWWHYGRM